MLKSEKVSKYFVQDCINILEEPNVILNYLKKGYDKTPKNIPTVSGDWLKIDWKCIKIALII